MICYLARHGKDDDAVRGGWSRQPLSGEGQAQAAALAEFVQRRDLAVSRIYSSDLPRALQTAQPVADKLRLALEKLKQLGIRTAVISNLDFSGYLLKERLDDLFPGNEFEFVIASSDYGLRKPMRDIFRAGIAKTGLKPERIWYVGDKAKVDVDGSRAAGMVPVLYKCKRNTYGTLPEDLITVDDLSKLTELMK